MFGSSGRKIAQFFGIASATTSACSFSEVAAYHLPDPTYDTTLVLDNDTPPQTIVIAGGCFWGVQAVFQHVKGVQTALSGYAGGDATTAYYSIVSSGLTQHAEAVQITYDPSQITLGKIFKIFFSVAHNPTELNRQGPDQGTQYRSAIFIQNEEQKKIALKYIEQLHNAKIFPHPIVTKIETLDHFYLAEEYHQDYASHHPDNLYIAINDLPKVGNLEKEFPEVFVKR